VRADAPTEGENTSRIANVAIPVSEIIMISFIFSFPENTYAAIATAIPSIRYLTPRVIISAADGRAGSIEGAASFLSAILYSRNEEKWMTIITYHTSIDADVIKKFNIYDAGERQFDFYIMVYLNSPDGWSQDGYFFEPVEKHKAKIQIRLSLGKTINDICGVSDNLSCAILHGTKMYLCAERWFHGAPKSKLNLEDYRQYMVSHEMGHILGKDHSKCPGKGHLAPIMLQQTLGIGECIPNTNVKE
jgi:hypothetical protein